MGGVAPLGSRILLARSLLEAAAPSQAWDVLSHGLAAVARLSPTPSAWFRSRTDDAGYAPIGEDFVLPLKGAEEGVSPFHMRPVRHDFSDESARGKERRSRRCEP